MKISFQHLDKKVAVLRKKRVLKDTGSYKRVMLKSSKSHAERLIELHTRTLLRHLPQGNNLRVHDNGRFRERQASDRAPQDANWDAPLPSGSIKLARLNVCGWTKYNRAFRENIVCTIDVDIVSICETHLPTQDMIEIDSY